MGIVGGLEDVFELVEGEVAGLGSAEMGRVVGELLERGDVGADGLGAGPGEELEEGDALGVREGEDVAAGIEIGLEEAAITGREIREVAGHGPGLSRCASTQGPFGVFVRAPTPRRGPWRGASPWWGGN